jgi:hypothetical protein
MKQGVLSKESVRKLRLFLYLAGVESTIGVYFLLSGHAKHTMLIVLASLVMLALAGSVIILAIRVNPDSPRLIKILAAFDQPWVQALPAVLLIGFSAGLSFLGLFETLLPILIFCWLVGLEFLFIFPPTAGTVKVYPVSMDTYSKPLAFAGVLLAYLSILIPTRIPTILDGIPWETPAEFLLAALLIPLAFAIHARFFSKPIVLILLGVALAVTIPLSIWLPESGLKVRAYQSEDDLLNNRWTKTYNTLIYPSVSQVLKAPYNLARELPVEWINSYDYRSEDEIWVTLMFEGYGVLQEGEKLIFLTWGADNLHITFTDPATDKSYQPIIVNNLYSIADRQYEENTPAPRKFKISGSVLVKGLSWFHLEPIVLAADGSVKSALPSLKIWTSMNGVNFPSEQLAFFVYLLGFKDLMILGIISLGLISGIVRLFLEKQAAALDLFLAASGVSGFFITGYVPRANMDAVILFTLVALGIVILIRFKRHAREMLSYKAFFLCVGVVLLLLFLRMDFSDLRKVVVFPAGEDDIEYQTFARNIYVNGDPLLVHTPPRAYKVLFPYLVGLFHILFGQSAVAILYLNVWCALLCSLLLYRVLNGLGASPPASFAAMIALLVILCLPSFFIFFFRFGLIEPLALLCLSATIFFAQQHRLAEMRLSGWLTLLFRLDYFGAAAAALILLYDPILGSTKAAWKRTLDLIKSNWRFALSYAVILLFPSLSIILFYYLFTPDYMLNAGDTIQRSLSVIVDGLKRLAIGGSLEELSIRFSANPLDAILVTLPLVSGTMIGVLSLIYRRGVLAKIDMRWSLLVLGLFSAYLFVHVTGYAPRFSVPLLPLALIGFVLLFRAFSLSRHPLPST